MNDLNYDLNSSVLLSRDRSDEFNKMKKKYNDRLNSDLDTLILKFKQITLNVSTLLAVDYEDKMIKNCCVCGVVFGKIFSKKQKCLVCGYAVCANCNNHPLPVNSFDKVKPPPNPNKPVQNVNVCTICYKTLSTAIDRNQHQIMRQRGSSSVFVEFYEKMHLNILDLRRNINSYKQVVHTITDSASPNIKRAKELESTINIHLSELKTGVTKLKELKGPTPRQQQVIQHVHHSLATQLNTLLPEFKLYNTECLTKMKQTPATSPASIKSQLTNVKSVEQSPTSSSPPASPSLDQNGSSGSFGSSNRLSTFFSNVFNFGDNNNTPTSSIGGSNSRGHSRSGSQATSYEDLPNRSVVLSVVPALCPLNGGCIAIQGENLDKPVISVTVDGLQAKVLMKNNFALLVMCPPRSEGEYFLSIKDGDNLVTKQSIIYTNSCFSTEKDIDDSNRYAMDYFNNASLSNFEPISDNMAMHSPAVESNNFSYENDLNIQTMAEIVGSPDKDMGINDLDAIAATGNSFDDMVIQKIEPVVYTSTDNRVTLYLKYSLVAGSMPLISIDSTPVTIELGNMRKSVSFAAPLSLKEGFHTIDIILQLLTQGITNK
ncbi:hypothetical protein SAMD00019534_021930 [Acytostelium subglobosum LB1]|uniref:hypothetical protein n=1 Tax=Acytostelium subglobosum LB1 TaxID=1410327 RepID=UPI0006449337|nr:hypothetical protein SAMD00019534_021930 [Acytostelium subglobosum LB1]GAM19018.1 hypothetical protein SAMD00019534_021930 [Acytostelium subglobosum LB1]|eukprot:XP_012756945.1 hypothetical protein SAMD00019534_021930 [Acytostelium subglobosum LB1]